MGWRKTGLFHAPQAILVMTCDVCERDIGFEDGSRPRADSLPETGPETRTIVGRHNWSELARAAP